MHDQETRARVARQLLQYLQSLQAAGVSFLPGEAGILKSLKEPVSTQIVPPSQPAKKLSNPLPDSIDLKLQLPTISNSQSSTHTSDVSFDSPIPESAQDRIRELKALSENVAGCSRCPELFGTRTQTVFGVGPVDVDVCFVGEAPGADEDARGVPFVGRAGQLLDKIIAASGFKREEVYICNTIKCRPPNNRPPTADERRNCRHYFDRQIALVKPKFIVCLGATAAKNVLNTNLGIGTLRGTVRDLNGIPVICTYHPSALLRDDSPGQDLKRACWEDMKMLLRTMGRPVPGTN